MSAGRRQLAVTAEMAEGKTPYLPIPFRSRGGLQWVRCGSVRLERPAARDRKLLTTWLGRPEIQNAFGYPLSLTSANVEGGWLPDLTLPRRFIKNERGYGEPVEFLVVRRLEGRRRTPVGLCVVYEHRGAGDPTQEVDFALPELSDRGSLTFVQQVQMCVFCYLFLVCGADCVTWRRRRAPAGTKDTWARKDASGSGAADRVRITLDRFRKRLRRTRRHTRRRRTASWAVSGRTRI